MSNKNLRNICLTYNTQYMADKAKARTELKPCFILQRNSLYMFTCFTRPSGLSTRSLPLFTFKVTVERRGSIAYNLNSNLHLHTVTRQTHVTLRYKHGFRFRAYSILPLNSDWSDPNMFIIDNVPNLHSSLSHNLLTLYGSYKNSNSCLSYKS